MLHDTQIQKFRERLRKITMMSVPFAILIFITLTACAAPTPHTPTPTAKPASAIVTPTVTPTPDAQGARVRLDPITYTYWISGPEILELASEVRVTELASGAQTTLFRAPAATTSMDIRNITAAAFSPDGARVLLSFANYGNSGGSLRLVSADGKTSQPFWGEGKPQYDYALWSPDGTRIVTRAIQAPYCLTLASTDGATTRSLTCLVSDYPRFWSTDGKWIAVMSYSAPPHSDANWYAVSTDNAQRVPLTSLTNVQWYDQRYFPYRTITRPTCSAPTDPRSAKRFSFWRCE